LNFGVGHLVVKDKFL